MLSNAYDKFNTITNIQQHKNQKRMKCRARTSCRTVCWWTQSTPSMIWSSFWIW